MANALVLKTSDRKVLGVRIPHPPLRDRLGLYGGPSNLQDRHGRAWDVWEVDPSMTERRSARQDTTVTVERRRRSEPRCLRHCASHGSLSRARQNDVA